LSWREPVTGAVLAALFSLIATGPAAATGLLGDDAGFLQASNLFEYQAGRDPTVEAEDLTEWIDQFILDYTRGQLRLGLRVERYQSSLDQPPVANYDELTQKYAEWSTPDLRVRFGNGYVILGRGLLFRAFELPGVVRDPPFPRSRYLESRDLDGTIVEARQGRFVLTALTGQPVKEPGNPYGAEDQFVFRRGGSVSGGRLGIAAGRGLTVGASYLRHEGIVQDLSGPGRPEEDGAADLELRLTELVPPLARAGLDARFYGEYAGRMWRPFHDGLDARDGVPHAIYTATELSWGSWGLSCETKRYHRFQLKVNDPPNLVPEFSYHLVNRASHFLLPDDEQGWQLAAQGAITGKWTLQAVRAQAVNRLDDGFGHLQDARRYDAWLVGLDTPASAAVHGTLFGAGGQDEIEGITNHYILGAQLGYVREDGWGASADFEFQQARRKLSGLDRESIFDNVFASLGISRSGLGVLAVQAEFSNDPLEEDDPLTFTEVETEPVSWWGLAGNLQINTSHELTFFAGNRRGGTVCTSGTCYLVPDFSGAEIRLTSRF
jgi:hypothetical protein